MIDPKLIHTEEGLSKLEAGLAKRGVALDKDKLHELDVARRSNLQKLEEARAAKKKISSQIGGWIREGLSPDEAKAKAAEQLDELSATIDTADAETHRVEAELHEFLISLPNIPDESVPVGDDESANVVLRTWGEKPKFDFEPKPHWEIAEELGLIDFERAAALSGSRFAVYKGLGARLERSLANYMLNMHTDVGYEEVIPPYLVSSETMTGTGQLPKFAHDLFKIDEHDLWLIPTAEVPVTNLAKDSILKEEQLPLRYTAFTPCFRAEAGAAGRDTRGIARQHQFHKVELVHLCTAAQGPEELESLTAQAEQVLQSLGLHYRVVDLCTGDLGFGAAKTYDLEVWSPGQDRYVEISSCSLMKQFQGRRMKARYKNADGKNIPLTTLNGSALAVGRTWLALVENYQQADGSVAIPEPLKALMGCDRITA